MKPSTTLRVSTDVHRRLQQLIRPPDQSFDDIMILCLIEAADGEEPLSGAVTGAKTEITR